MRFAIVIAVMAGSPMMAYAEDLPETTNRRPAAVMIAQNATQPPASHEPATSTEDQKTESSTAEKKEAEKPSKTPLKNFRPSEQIEAEQAVDFPYDI
jgi:hypothetical protein